MFLLKSRQTLKFETYKKQFNDIKNTINIYTHIEIGEKIGKDISNGYYIFPATYYQLISRWWWSENRSKTIIYLNDDFDKFVNLLDNIYDDMNYTKNNKLLYDNLLRYTKREIIPFINELILGLYNLKQTYIDCKKIKAKIDSIILTFIDYKNKITSIHAYKATI